MHRVRGIPHLQLLSWLGGCFPGVEACEFAVQEVVLLAEAGKAFR